MTKEELQERKLKPCPFCGCEVDVVEKHDIKNVRFFRIRCMNIRCLMQPQTEWNKNEEIVIERWNSRPD